MPLTTLLSLRCVRRVTHQTCEHSAHSNCAQIRRRLADARDLANVKRIKGVAKEGSRREEALCGDSDEEEGEGAGGGGGGESSGGSGCGGDGGGGGGSGVAQRARRT